jgi:hypothetical protein
MIWREKGEIVPSDFLNIFLKKVEIFAQTKTHSVQSLPQKKTYSLFSTSHNSRLKHSTWLKAEVSIVEISSWWDI